MENKINIAELLKDCPTGMELDCSMWDGVTFEGINDVGYIEILIKTPNGQIGLTREGCFIRNDKYAKCVIFPKGKTTWEGFVPPCKFNAGDVLVSAAGNIVLYSHIDSENFVHYHCILPTYSNFRIEENTDIGVGRYYECTLANKQQRQRMYDEIKRSGYKYNSYTNKLEKLIEPKFKVGDRIRHKTTNKDDVYEIRKIYDDSYGLVGYTWLLYMKYQNQYELVPDKFDITTLKPFDKVLVRHDRDNTWCASLFSHMGDNLSYCYKFVTTAGKSYPMCIPYKGNEHLLGTTNDCNDFYKIWE